MTPDVPDRFARDPAEGGRDTVDHDLSHSSDKRERERIQQKQGGHHLPPHATEDPLDDTDRNSDKIIKPSKRQP